MVSEEGIEKALEDIETLKKGLAKLTINHVAVVKQLRQQLLDLQQDVSALKINSDVNILSSILDDSELQNKLTLKAQLIADASTAKAKILNSANPANLANEFKRKWDETLRKLGVDFISF